MNSSLSLFVDIIGYGFLSVFSGIFVHELGHLMAARMLGIEVLSVSIGFGSEITGFTDRWGTRWKLAALLIGGVCSFQNLLEQNRDPPACPLSRRRLADTSPQWRAMVYAAGPIFNLLFAAAIMLIQINSSRVLMWSQDADLDLSKSLVIVSLAMGLFNLLPFPPLDGGRLVLIGIEALRAAPLSRGDEKWILKLGSYVLASTSALVFLIFIIYFEQRSQLF